MAASTTASDEEEYVKGAVQIVKDTILAPLRAALSKPARRAYIQTLLLLLGALALLGVAIASYSVFYFAYVPTRGFSVPVHLQFPAETRCDTLGAVDRAPACPPVGSAYRGGGYEEELREQLSGNRNQAAGSGGQQRGGGRGSIGLEEGEEQAPKRHPWGTATGIRHWLVSEQGYDVRVELDMPRTRANRDAGNFMVELALLGPPEAAGKTHVGSGIVGTYADGKRADGLGEDGGVTLALSRRPAILTWYSDAVENVGKAVALPWYVLGWRREAEKLVVGMMEDVRFERGVGNVPEALRVEVRAVERLQVYGMRVVFKARLRGLRYLMYTYRLPAAFVFTTVFWAVELTFMILAWLALSSIFSPAPPRPTTIKAEGEQEPKTQPDEPESEINIKTEPETETDVPDLSDTPRTFPTYAGQRPLRYESPRVKSEEEDEGAGGEQAAGAGGGGSLLEADDEDDEDADFVLDTAGRYMERDSGLGTSMESGQDRRRGDAVRKRRSGGGFFGGGGSGGGGGGGGDAGSR